LPVTRAPICGDSEGSSDTGFRRKAALAWIAGRVEASIYARAWPVYKDYCTCLGGPVCGLDTVFDFVVAVNFVGILCQSWFLYFLVFLHDR
jgi:hypothetical protein